MISLKKFKDFEVEKLCKIRGGADWYSRSKATGSTVDYCNEHPRDEFSCAEDLPGIEWYPG